MARQTAMSGERMKKKNLDMAGKAGTELIMTDKTQFCMGTRRMECL